MSAPQVDEFVKEHVELQSKFHQKVNEIKKEYSWKHEVLHAALALKPSEDRVDEILKDFLAHDLAEMQELEKITTQHFIDLGNQQIKIASKLACSFIQLTAGAKTQNIKEVSGIVASDEGPATKPPTENVIKTAEDPATKATDINEISLFKGDSVQLRLPLRALEVLRVLTTQC